MFLNNKSTYRSMEWKKSTFWKTTEKRGKLNRYFLSQLKTHYKEEIVVAFY